MSRCLLTWSDRSTTVRGEPPPSKGGEPPDRGPLMRLLDHSEVEYQHVRLLTSPQGEPAAQRRLAEILARGTSADLRVLPIVDPSDHAQVFAALHGVTEGLPPVPLDVCLSAGTPQMQTLWVIMVEAGLLPARMLQVIPPAFVPSVHPHPIREVRLEIEGFPQIRALKEEVVRLRAAGRRSIVGDSPAMHELSRRLLRVARSDVPVLVQGETGTGKELVARAIHESSERASGPFVAESCGAFAEGVLASELFGHERGAFTGAQARRRGLFEQADGGTLFLDEVGEMSPRVQAMLLRVVQEGTLRRVGGERSIDVDVRVVAATHRDLPQLVARGDFREDLYYRLAGATLHVPPLRERGADLERLVAFFLDELSGPRPWPTPAAWRCLRSYAWPGNVRQLRAEVVRWTVFCEHRVEVEDLSPQLRALAEDDSAPAAGSRPGLAADARPGPARTTLPSSPRTLAEAVSELEAQVIREALVREGSLMGAARALAIDRNTLKRKLRRLGLR
ncbi:sigma-54 interaction domain-containing protein [Paraliomyxa miuraensis]|uniref:sigma-54 interaction domain-containing protein n=1 Tax=Paraliomyxa miuraensis TaxID=376150 RepID=UPI00224DC25E|nr:sigma-54 dependent transcriptional regulator [Paraliomyxa miuraensis]MCX4241524.1 sigma-54 dependent transcriptional regulator [Paraliomyxa miuraensis]